MLHRGAGHHPYAELAQGLVYRLADTLGQRRQHTRAGFDQADVQVFRADPVEPVGGQHLRGVVQFRSQFDAGGAGADDGDTHCVVVRVVPGMRTQVLAE